LITALLATVALLVTTAYFLLGSVPLLILKHDTPMESRFVRGFFNTCYLAAMVTAGSAAMGYGFAGRLMFAAGAATLAVLATILLWRIIPQMDSLRSRIQVSGADAIPGFRRTHLIAVLVNLAQLVLIVWSVTTFSFL